MREILPLREKASNFHVGIFAFFDTSKELQNYAIAVDDRTVALFRPYGPRLQVSCGGPAENVQCVRARRVDFPFKPTKNSILFNRLKKTTEEPVVCKRISQVQVCTTRYAVYLQPRGGALRS